MRGRSPSAVLEEAIRGGVTLVQLREKSCSDEEFLALACAMKAILSAHRIPLIINDRVDIALAAGADGVHLGQSDMHWTEARRLLGEHAIIGLSVESLAQAHAAENARIDYLGVSSIFPTATKSDIRHVWGLEGLQVLRELTHHRLVGIGGIDASNAESVLRAGTDGLAVVSALCAADEPSCEAERLLALIEKVKSCAPMR